MLAEVHLHPDIRMMLEMHPSWQDLHLIHLQSPLMAMEQLFTMEEVHESSVEVEDEERLGEELLEYSLELQQVYYLEEFHTLARPVDIHIHVSMLTHTDRTDSSFVYKRNIE